MNADYLIKVYELDNLLDPFDTIRHRIECIESLTQDTLAPVKFELYDNKLIRYTKKIKNRASLKYGDLTSEQMHVLGNALDEMYGLGIIHGDLNRKNIILTDNADIFISDWEPSLLQRVNGKSSLMSTLPWIDPIDSESQKLSIKTDLLCFCRVITNYKKPYFYSKLWREMMDEVISDSNPFNSMLKRLRILKGVLYVSKYK